MTRTRSTRHVVQRTRREKRYVRSQRLIFAEIHVPNEFRSYCQRTQHVHRNREEIFGKGRYRPGITSELGAVPKGGGSPADQIAKIVKIADAAGFKFTPQEYESFAKEEDAQKEVAMQFIKKAKTDPVLKAKLSDIPPDSSYEKSIDELLKIAAGTGFHFTARTYDAAAYETLVQENPEVELSDEYLEKIAAGVPYDSYKRDKYYYYGYRK